MRFPLLLSVSVSLLTSTASADPAPTKCDVVTLPSASSEATVPANAHAVALSAMPSSLRPRAVVTLRSGDGQHAALGEVDFRTSTADALGVGGPSALFALGPLTPSTDYDLEVALTCQTSSNTMHVPLHTGEVAPLPTRLGQLQSGTDEDGAATLTLTLDPAMRSWSQLALVDWYVNGDRYERTTGYPSASASSLYSARCTGSAPPPPQDVTVTASAIILGESQAIEGAETTLHLDCSKQPGLDEGYYEDEPQSGCTVSQGQVAPWLLGLLGLIVSRRHRR